MSDQGLNLPNVTLPEFNRNFIRTAVCELRFPILLELEKSPPVKFHNSLRKDFPLFERRASFNLGTESKESAYVFSSKDKKWTLSVKPASISLETSQYSSYTDFKTNLKKITAAAKDFIESSFYTRIGLRYIDIIEFDTPLDAWLNKDIIAPLAAGKYGQVARTWHIMRGVTNNTSYTFQYGVREEEKQEFTLDFDFYQESVESDKAIDTIDSLHKESLKLFRWCLGEKSISHLTK
jgi:uncharacterized protein (TIGR04255 family)